MLDMGNYLNFPGKEVIMNDKTQQLGKLTVEEKYFSNHSFISGD